MSEPGRRKLFLLLCAIALLHTGAHICQSFVNYPNWHLIDSRSFPAYHWGITIRAGTFLALPRLVEIVIGSSCFGFDQAELAGGWSLPVLAWLLALCSARC